MLGGLRAACDELGAVLVRSAHSANIKERRDASTALFDREGQMVMEAEHIPVHLGAMPSAVVAGNLGWCTVLDAITLQVMLGGLRASCDEMGAVVLRSAHSANIKERRDASAALFDREGEMVMQSEHIPVHLCAMPSAVEAV